MLPHIYLLPKKEILHRRLPLSLSFVIYRVVSKLFKTRGLFYKIKSDAESPKYKTDKNGNAVIEKQGWAAHTEPHLGGPLATSVVAFGALHEKPSKTQRDNH